MRGISLSIGLQLLLHAEPQLHLQYGVPGVVSKTRAHLKQLSRVTASNRQFSPCRLGLCLDSVPTV
jgi:hypothetical protein